MQRWYSAPGNTSAIDPTGEVITATAAVREQLGEKVTKWMAEHPQCKPVEFVVTQSSDEAFHCLAITLFYFDDARK